MSTPDTRLLAINFQRFRTLEKHVNFTGKHSILLIKHWNENASKTNRRNCYSGLVSGGILVTVCIHPFSIWFVFSEKLKQTIAIVQLSILLYYFVLPIPRLESPLQLVTYYMTMTDKYHATPKIWWMTKVTTQWWICRNKKLANRIFFITEQIRIINYIQ